MKLPSCSNPVYWGYHHPTEHCTPAHHGPLPFTGANLLLIVLCAAVALGLGVLLRRLGRG